MRFLLKSMNFLNADCDMLIKQNCYPEQSEGSLEEKVF
jgi:hypothetical protein